MTSVAAALAVAVVAQPARADDKAPVITHVPPGTCPQPAIAGGPPPPCVVEATIVDTDGVFDPTLLVRLKGVQAFERVAMKPKAGAVDVFQATVPATLSVAGGVEYLIEAFDVEGNGPSRAGDEATPLVLEKAAAVVPPVDPVEDNTGLIIGVVAGVGVAVVAGVAIGVAVYALRPPAPTEVGIVIAAPSPLALTVTP